MCRPSCCRQPCGEGAGIAAVAVVLGAAYTYAKIGPVLARIWHLAIEALTIFTLTAAAAAAAIMVTWAAAQIIGQRRQARRSVISHRVPAAVRQFPAEAGPVCLACGDTGTVLRAIPGPGYQQQPCPACQPAHRAG